MYVFTQSFVCYSIYPFQHLCKCDYRPFAKNPVNLLQEGLAMIDDGHRDGKRRYWFPCVSPIASTVGADTWQALEKGTDMTSSDPCSSVTHVRVLYAHGNDSFLSIWLYIMTCELKCKLIEMNYFFNLNEGGGFPSVSMVKQCQWSYTQPIFLPINLTIYIQ